MRRAGHSLKSIGRHFGRDHTTILYHCQKAGLSELRSVRNKVLVIDLEIREEVKEPVIEPEPSEIMNLGKNYEDYLAEEKKRDWRRRNDIADNGI